MPMFRKLPPLVQAEQFLGTKESMRRVSELAGDNDPRFDPAVGILLGVTADDILVIVSEGTWLIKTHKGAFRVMNDADFRERYTRA